MDVLTSLRTGLSRPRVLLTRIPARPVGVVLLCVATALAAWMLVPRTGTEEVLVAAHDLAPGTSLQPSDVRVADYPPDLAPADALTESSDVAVAVTGGAIASGTPLTSASLVGPDSGIRPEGTVLAPTVFGDSQAVSVVRPGHRLRVFTAKDGAGDAGAEADEAGLPGAADSPDALLSDAVVTAVHTPTGGMGQGSTVVTLAISEEEAAALAHEAGSYLTFALLN
ncbi:SAF domain-containing protein [Brevibacterium jeotgali]|uniref:SAF domain-containing protein n=1 Tax=Brevibacterium jeotgali TaxID=1262550 RepID=A0A2H1L417_9MICO|nr:SAF domain-containing protein [Brevibacterium jeotgali]TWB98764.1 SAF domain-containing protein [Brevibacterium jeotgali]SMY11636.1 SAF domain-containing protein [Brevibacterium jeotgali]